jgi:hypothetical protein
LGLAGQRRNWSHIRSVARNGGSWGSRGSGHLVAVLGRICSIALLGSCASCAFFYRQPALPQRVAIEARETPQTDESFTALVQGADIIYFPIELLGPGARTEPATKLVEALQRSGSAFTIGLDLIAGDEQTLLDQWAKRELSTEKLVTHLHLSGTPRERENCRVFLGQAKDWDVRFLALRGPANVPAAAQSETSRELLAEEFAAARIIEHFRRHRDRKLLVLIHRRHLENDPGVPSLVAQKVKARQLVLDAKSHPSSRSQLLAWSGRHNARNRYGSWGR